MTGWFRVEPTSETGPFRSPGRRIGVIAVVAGIVEAMTMRLEKPRRVRGRPISGIVATKPAPWGDHMVPVSLRFRRAMASLATLALTVPILAVSSSSAGATVAYNWVERSPSVSPCCYYDSAMAYDSTRHMSMLFGGYGGGAWDNTKPGSGTGPTGPNSLLPPARRPALRIWSMTLSVTSPCSSAETMKTYCSITLGSGTVPTGLRCLRPPRRRTGQGPPWSTIRSATSLSCSAAEETPGTSTTRGSGTAPTGPSSNLPPARRPAPDSQ